MARIHFLPSLTQFLGRLWTSVFSIAGGALICVSMLTYHSGRKQTTNDILMLGVFVGLPAGVKPPSNCYTWRSMIRITQ